MDFLSKNSGHYMAAKAAFSSKRDERGFAVVLALVILALLTISGITAIKMSVTESCIVRNTAVHKQNLQLAEMAANEGIREILNRQDPFELKPGGSAAEEWMFGKGNDPEIGVVDYDPGDKVTEAESVSDSSVLDQRGEQKADTLWYYFVGWDASEGSSLKTTESMWRTGKVVGVYNSEEYGSAAVELGVTKRF